MRYQKYSDGELLQLTRDGSGDAFDELYHRYGRKMHSYFFRMLWKNESMAEDFTQDLFMKIFKAADSFDHKKEFSTWVYSIAHNMCKNEYKKHEVRAKHVMTEKKSVDYKEPVNPDFSRFRIALQSYVNKLDEEKRELYILRFQENLSVPQISGIINIPEGTVKSRIFYLLKELKTQLKEFQNLLTYP